MYKIIGVDGREYGPVGLEQVQQWVAEGRVNARTLVQPEGVPGWKAAVEVPEINSLLAIPVPSAAAPGPAPPAQVPESGAPAPQKGLAITSFVLGVVSFALCLGIFTGIPAIICGHVAKNRTHRAPEQCGGAGLATAGLILGYLSVLYTILIIAMLVPVLTHGRGPGQLRVCNSNMKQVALALRVWAIDHQGEFPFNVSTNAGGTREFCQTGFDGFDRNAAVHFAAIAKELGSTAPLVCPSDSSKRPARDFGSLKPQNITYLLHTGPEVTDTNASEVLLKCPVHGTLLRCDGSVELKFPGRRVRL